MFACKLGDEYKNDFTAKKFQVAYEFLQRKDLAELPLGWIELEDGVRASVQAYTTQPREELEFETHELYYDIHYVVEGNEIIGVRPRTGLEVSKAYDTANDITFYKEVEEPATWVYLGEGDLVIVSNDEALKPHVYGTAPMAVKKIVIKVPV